ncbi:cupin domain-containing protein [Actinomadura sp. DC4]|uniref:JmjC domain-containing protein n=1 Tax=Actinomadura sp. DC4 TaxID=3055069 RepID=UPI0025B10ABD|nr:cupin domain-containing protein [Actinomadura sp. DC4]MDN3358573.1 cupin domain-containing protein [Actinomadura sp. DC4]
MNENPSMLAALVDDLDAFATRLPTEPILSKRPAEPLRALIDFDAVDRLLSDHALRYPFVEMIKDGARLPKERFLTGPVGLPNGISELANATLVAGELENGASLVLNDLHFTWQPIAGACRHLSHEVGMPAHANAYLTPHGSQGFDHHHDTHSVFIVQTEGSKTWQLYRPFLPLPLERHAWPRQVLPPEEWHRLRELPPDHEFVLEPGNVLFIPRGWIHNVFATDEPSLHLTVGLAETSRHSIVPTLVEALADDLDLRRDLPLRFAQDHDSAEEAVRSVLADLARWAGQADVAGLAARVVAAQRARLLPAPNRPLSSVRPDGHDLPAAVAVRHETIAGVDRPGDRTELHLGDRVLRFTGRAAAVLDLLLRAPSVTRLDTLAEDWPPETVEATVRTLLTEGVLVAAGERVDG